MLARLKAAVLGTQTGANPPTGSVCTEKLRFMELADQIGRREGLSQAAAMERAKIERPADFRAAFPGRARRRSHTAGARTEARAQLLSKAAEIARRERVPEYVAMSRAGAEHPELMRGWA